MNLRDVVTSTTHKICTLCKEEKPLEEFRRNNQGLLGRTSRCKECLKILTPEQKQRGVEQRKEWHSNNKHKFFEYSLRNTYNMTLYDYGMLWYAQGGCCAICGVPESSSVKLHIDHDHSCCPGNTSCGTCVRGLLCFNCNSGIGQFKEDLRLLDNAKFYLSTYTP